MKKSILQFSVIAAIAASMTLTTSCSSDDGVEAFVPTPVQFGANLNSLGMTRTDPTPSVWGNRTIDDKWTSDATFAVGEKVALITYDDTKNEATPATIKGFQYSVKTGSASNIGGLQTASEGSGNQIYWVKATETKKIIAWSYGNSDAISNPETVPASFTVDNDQSSNTYKNKELLWGYKEATNTTPSPIVDVPLYHQLARIDVTIKAETQAYVSTCYIGKKANTYTGGGTIYLTANFTPKLQTTTAYGSWAVATTAGDYSDYMGSWSGHSNAGYITPRLISIETPASGDDEGKKISVYSAVVLPASYTANSLTLFEIEADGIRYVYIPNDATTEFKAGNKYSYTVNVGPKGVEVTATIKPWNSQNIPDVNATLEPALVPAP